MDPNEHQWRINSSFSPPMSRRWTFQCVNNVAATNGSSTSSRGRGSRSGVSSGHYPNHQHSVSDGALSYYGSPSENLQAPQWVPPVQRYDLGEFSTPSGGARPEGSVFFQNNERRFTSRVSSTSSSLGSPPPLSELSQWPSTNKPIFFPPRHFSGRRSFMSKPVYPLVYRNPVSDGEIYGSSYSPDLKFQKTLSHLQRMEAFSDPNTSSSRREGFRWSNASSYDFGFDGDTIDIMDHICLDQTPRSPYMNKSVRQQKCALCERPLWQKSPWSTHRIVRSTDMPVTGVLPCHHVFHADCLEETTPKSQINEPPCPVCQRASDGSISFSEPLQVVADGSVYSNIQNPDWTEGEVRRNQSLPMPRRRGGSLLKGHFRKRFSFKGKVGKDLFGAKTRDPSSSSSSLPCDNNNNSSKSRLGRLRFHE